MMKFRMHFIILGVMSYDFNGTTLGLLRKRLSKYGKDKKGQFPPPIFLQLFKVTYLRHKDFICKATYF